MEQHPDYTNVLFQDAQDPWEDFQSLLHIENTPYTVTNPDSPASSTPKMTDADEEKYLQAEASLDQRQIHRAKRQYEKETGKISLVAYKTVRHHRYHNSSSVTSLEGSMGPENMRLQGKDFLVRAEFGKEEFMKIIGTITEEDMRVREADEGGQKGRNLVLNESYEERESEMENNLRTSVEIGSNNFDPKNTVWKELNANRFLGNQTPISVLNLHPKFCIKLRDLILQIEFRIASKGLGSSSWPVGVIGDRTKGLVPFYRLATELYCLGHLEANEAFVGMVMKFVVWEGQVHGFVIDTPAGGVTLPFFTKLFVQLLTVGFDPLGLAHWSNRDNWTYSLGAGLLVEIKVLILQLQFVDLPEASSALTVLHDQFLSDPSAVFEAARRDYLNMKCCSLNAKDLDFHYKRMPLLFYKLNGFNEPTLKHVFLASLPEELQPAIQRQPTASNLALDNISLGKIFQLAKREFKRKHSSRCFICKKKGHYAKDCPNKRENSIRLVEHLQATTDYSPDKDELEFYFSEQDAPNDETVFTLQNSSEDSDSDQSQVIFHQQLLSLDTTVSIPSIKLHILPSKFQRHVPAIGLIDTGAQRSMLNPHILPLTYWTKSEEHFKVVNDKLFTTSLITKKPIGIQIFPNCVIWSKVIGSTLPNKDILLGFDILHQIKHLQIIPIGIRVKSMFKTFIDVLKLYNLSETPQSYQDISTKLLSFCPESHSEFTYPNPLWKNKGISAGNPSLRTTGPKYSLNYCSSGITTPLFRRRENYSFMASTSSSAPVTLSSTLSLPKSCTSHTANKIKNLVEYSYIPESTQISESSYPLISPYQLYKRPSSFTRSIRTLISTRRPHPKEYIQSSRLDQCSLQATPAEQYVTLEIPSELISNWKREGYTHLHLGGIRLILTLHGRKGLPVTARIAMLDTRFKQYQDAVIGTVLTTLHAGIVLLTFYPNFNLSLQDTNLPTALKVQVQIQGAEQISSAKIATLHHQLVYRL
ncbi:hypothetical protein KPL71_021585 [Citrus sinensis]|uniref:Uncharacterized protein n=1 Tax=Citrus sinensis TaxID=2711 RepID=A0ACB8JGA8_CITSI|nr:hypothetical protein KPL71_021585 [Citrus sinensis]